MRKALMMLAALMLAASNLTAQEPSRVLNGYQFIPSRVVPNPFAISYFGSTTGGGVAFELKTPFVDLNGDTLGTLTGDVAFMALGFEYQQRFGQWFAARVAFAGSGRLGIDEQSVLAQGVTGSFAWNLGATARILQSEKVILSGALDFARTDLIGLDPFGFAQSIIDGGLEQDENSLVASTDAISGVLGVRVGWAPAPWVGITGLVETGRGDVTDESSETLIGGGATVGIDLKNLGVVPIGFLLTFDTDAFSPGGADLASRSTGYGLGVYYTGWDDFSIGVETSMRVLDRRDAEDDFEAFIATFNLQYWP
jgi:hypothetical protein